MQQLVNRRLPRLRTAGDLRQSQAGNVAGDDVRAQRTGGFHGVLAVEQHIPVHLYADQLIRVLCFQRDILLHVGYKVGFRLFLAFRCFGRARACFLLRFGLRRGQLRTSRRNLRLGHGFLGWRFVLILPAQFCGQDCFQRGNQAVGLRKLRRRQVFFGDNQADFRDHFADAQRVAELPHGFRKRRLVAFSFKLLRRVGFEKVPQLHGEGGQSTDFLLSIFVDRTDYNAVRPPQHRDFRVGMDGKTDG